MIEDKATVVCAARIYSTTLEMSHPLTAVCGVPGALWPHYAALPALLQSWSLTGESKNVGGPPANYSRYVSPPRPALQSQLRPIRGRRTRTNLAWSSVSLTVSHHKDSPSLLLLPLAVARLQLQLPPNERRPATNILSPTPLCALSFSPSRRLFVVHTNSPTSTSASLQNSCTQPRDQMSAYLPHPHCGASMR